MNGFSVTSEDRIPDPAQHPDDFQYELGPNCCKQPNYTTSQFHKVV